MGQRLTLARRRVYFVVVAFGRAVRLRVRVWVRLTFVSVDAVQAVVLGAIGDRWGDDRADVRVLQRDHVRIFVGQQSPGPRREDQQEIRPLGRQIHQEQPGKR